MGGKRKLLDFYLRCLDRNPIITNSVTFGALMGLGDVACQTFIEQPAKVPTDPLPVNPADPLYVNLQASSIPQFGRQLDVPRTCRFVTIGALYYGPAVTLWYRQLDRLVAALFVASRPSTTAVIFKTVVDQALFAPVSLVAYLSFLSLLRRNDAEAFSQLFRRDYWTILCVNWSVWPFVQLLTFSVIPKRHRVLFVNGVGLAWNTFLSWRANRR